MVTLFKTVLGMSATGAGVILLVLLARLALGRAPKHFSYALWVVVTAVIAVIALGAALATNRASRPPAPETTLPEAVDLSAALPIHPSYELGDN